MKEASRVVSVLGGYGIFGGRIAEALSRDDSCRVRVVGRNVKVGGNFAYRIGADFRPCTLDDRDSLRRALDGSFAVIHAAGPFQGGDYRVAEVCLELGAHYLDLSDARIFVAGIGRLDADARRRGLLVVSGVSSTPAITSALINELTSEFSRIDEIHTALSPGNRNPRGVSTVAAVLSYVGREIRVWRDGRWVSRPGWGDARRLDFPSPVGRRRVYNCDVPDLELFPSVFNAQTVRFSAGLELNVLNHLLSVCSLPCRWLGLNLMRRAKLFLDVSLMLFPFGTTNGALAVWLRGRNHPGDFIERRIALVTDYDGPATPSSAAVVLTRKILASGPLRAGAFPCVGLLTLDELLVHLRPLGIWCVRGDESGWQETLQNNG
ncbi:MAG TPA: saccharopine dehydrogenase NADP-binding domain-containing protein [Pirellulales bacterium]|nr:saccharopine dehydrogenase NADP-binding domain-containing protein [Pirellulales bacterium]